MKPLTALISGLFSFTLVVSLATNSFSTPHRRFHRDPAPSRAGQPQRPDLRGSARPQTLTSRGWLMQNRREVESVILSSPKAIWVEKNARRLTLYENGVNIKSFMASIGRNEAFSKVHRNDWATPEGLYAVCEKNGGSKYHLALLINYPNAIDAERGLAYKLITPKQCANIKAAIERGHTPNQETRLGGSVEIHGGSNRIDEDAPEGPRLAGWTRGCVGLQNSDIDEIYTWATVGTPVLITP